MYAFILNSLNTSGIQHMADEQSVSLALEFNRVPGRVVAATSLPFSAAGLVVIRHQSVMGLWPVMSSFHTSD